MTISQWQKIGRASMWICIVCFFASWIVKDSMWVMVTYITSIVTLVLAGFVFMKKFKCPNCGKSLGTKFKEMNTIVTKCPHCNQKID